MPIIGKADFENLQYGNLVFAQSHQSKEKHFTFIISDGPHNMAKPSRSPAIHFGLTISSKPSSNNESAIGIRKEDLPQEVQNYYRNKGNLYDTSYLRWSEPVSIEIKHIEKVCAFDASSFIPLNNSICDLLCSDKYLFHRMLKNEAKYGGVYFRMGDVCCCYNYGTNPNILKLTGPCIFVNEHDVLQNELKLEAIENQRDWIIKVISDLKIDMQRLLSKEASSYSTDLETIEMEITQCELELMELGC